MKSNTVLLFAEYQTRKNKKQKTAFIQQVCSAAASAGYMSNVERTKSGARNIVVGDIASADVIYTAHYDTPSRSLLPGFVFPTVPFLTTLYQMLVAFAVLIPAAVGYIAASSIFSATSLTPAVVMLLSMLVAIGVFVLAMVLFVSGPPCTNNANANTSGVAALFEIMAEMPENLRSSVAFVFFDEQENGCIGSREFSKKHKRKIGHKLVVNFDCIGVGDDIVVATRSGAKKCLPAINAAFAECGGFEVTVTGGGKRIPSDHNNFKAGVGVSAFKRAGSGLLYASGMCSESDTLCREKNLKFVTDAAIALVKYVIGAESIPSNFSKKNAAKQKSHEKVIEEPKVEKLAEKVDVVKEADEEAINEALDESSAEESAEPLTEALTEDDAVLEETEE